TPDLHPRSKPRAALPLRSARRRMRPPKPRWASPSSTRSASHSSTTIARSSTPPSRFALDPHQHFTDDTITPLATELERTRKRVRGRRCNRLLQKPSRAVKARLHRLLRNLETLGGLGRRHVLDDAQHEHRPERLGHRVDRALHDASDLA